MVYRLIKLSWPGSPYAYVIGGVGEGGGVGGGVGGAAASPSLPQ